MKNLIIFLTFLCITQISYAQLQINPQIGLLFTSLDLSNKDEFDTDAKSGWMVGADVRFGKSLYLQPGLFLTSSKTSFTFQENGNSTQQIIGRTGLKLKGLVGYYILPTPLLKVRAAIGPTYDFQVDIDDINSNVVNSDEFKDGTFNFDITAGVNFLFLTLDVGYSFGLNDVLNTNNLSVNTKAKYKSVYVSVGLAF